MKNIKRIFTKTVALRLQVMGNELLFTEPNMKNDKFVVYVFRLTDKLLDDLTNITEEDIKAGNELSV